jgi:hypothetical protein
VVSEQQLQLESKQIERVHWWFQKSGGRGVRIAFVPLGRPPAGTSPFYLECRTMTGITWGYEPEKNKKLNHELKYK